MVFSSLTHTNLIVHESLQALDKFMLVAFINILLPEKNIGKDIVIARIEPGIIKITQRWEVIGDHLLFLVQQLLQSIQKKAETLMTEVINPTRKKTQTHKKISNPIFSQHCYCPAGLL